MSSPAISVVVPVYNNEHCLEELTGRIASHLTENKLTFEIIFIDDASADGSREIIKRLSHQNTTVKYLHLDSNAGQHRAIIKGLEIANGQRIVVMDADLQDQPELISEMNALSILNDSSVFVLRKGVYQTAGRMLTSHVIKIAVQLITGLHYKAGSYFMIPGSVLNTVLHISRNCPYPYISIIAGSCSKKISYLKAARLKSVHASGYTFRKRIQAAYRAFRCALYCKRSQMVLRSNGSRESIT